MTRREFLSIWPAALAARAGSIAPVIVPVRVIVDAQVDWHLELLRRFWWRIWPDAVRSFGRCGIQLQAAEGHGDVARPPGREPVVSGLDPHSLNLVLTNRIPMQWDSGRDLSGVTLRYRGYHLCMLALSRAHGNQIPFLSGQYVRPRDAPRTATRHFRKPARDAGRSVARVSSGCLCHAALVIAQRQRPAGIGAELRGTLAGGTRFFPVSHRRGSSQLSAFICVYLRPERV